MQKIECNICGSQKTKLLFDKGRGGENINNVICQGCGLVFISPRPIDEEINHHYLDGKFSMQARGDAKPSTEKILKSEKAAKNRFNRLRNTITLPQKGQCLEIGCGVGSFLKQVKTLGWQVMGLEPDLSYANTGSDIYQIKIDQGIYETQKYIPNQFDLIATFHVLEHTSSPRHFLAKIKQDLKPNGLLFIEVPTIDRPYNGNLEKFFWKPHLYSFSKTTLCGLLEEIGFTIIKATYTDNFLWVLAKSHPNSKSLVYPLDNPVAVEKRVLKLFNGYKRRKHFLFFRVAFALKRRAKRFCAKILMNENNQ